jgi:propanol-preferring alcohol dehydrogenase
MLAVRSHRAGEPLRLEEVPVPEPSGAEVRLRVAACGVCHTDLYIAETDRLSVTRPRTLGHEVAGYVDAAGPDAQRALRRARISDGDAVLVFGGWGCGDCRECHGGNEQRCARGSSPGFQQDGGYAEYMLVPDARHLVPLRRLDPVEAAPLADAGVTPYRAVQRAKRWLSPGARVLLIGMGGLGQFAIQYLRSIPGLTIAVRELDPDKLAIAERLGADLGVLGGDPSLVSHGLGSAVDVVFDMVGSDESLDYAAGNVTPGGLICLVGEAGGRIEFSMAQPPMESSLTSAAWGSLSDLRDVVGLAGRHRIRWNVERVPLRDVALAHQRLRTGDVDGRLVLVP